MVSQVSSDVLDYLCRAETTLRMARIQREGDLLQNLGRGRVISTIDVSNRDLSSPFQFCRDIHAESTSQNGFSRTDVSCYDRLAANIVVLYA